MVMRVAAMLTVALGLLVLPIRAAAQEQPSASVATESDAGIPYVRVDDGIDDPYRPLWFEEAGQMLSPLAEGIISASDVDAAQLLFASAADLGGFQDAPIGGELWRAAGVSLTGIAAPLVQEGALLSSTTAVAGGTTGTTVAGIEAAIPRLSVAGEDGNRRLAFAFTDDTGTPTAPPGELAPLTDPPAPPSEGIAAGPATTTSTTTPAAPPGTTAPAVPTTTPAPPATSPPPAATPTTATTSAPTVPPTTTTTTSVPTTTTTTSAPTTTSTTTTTTRPSTTTTTTTRPPTTTTTTATTTTTTTTVPTPVETFSLTQERPSATACVSGSAQACDALWDVPLAATGETHTLDLTLRNSGNVDAAGLQVWASAPCVTTSTASPAGTGDLCAAVELTVQRYTTANRDVPLECVYGGGTAQVCSLSAARTLAHLSSTHPSASQARSIGTGLQDGEAAHLRLTLRLPDVDNRYQRLSASMSLTWRQVQ